MTEREIFQGALDYTDPAQRAAYLDRACGADAALRARIEALLRSHDSASRFLNVPAMEQLHPSPENRPAHTVDFAATHGAGGNAGAQAEDDEAPDDEIEAAPDLSFLAPSQKPGTIGTLGHYEILQLLGQGAFGLVFKAFDEKLQRLVAIKVMNPQLAATSPPRKRFLREARSAAAIKHENIVQVYSVEEQPLPYMVMEYVEGETLKQKMDGTGPLELPEILHLGRQMASGLAAAHARGLIHRDIKPGNILIEAGPEQVKITDFGLARAADDATMTRTGVIAGTPMYMAPEQAQGLALDHRADLFSLGSVFYQMACGRPPFRGATTLAVLKRVTDESPRPIQEILAEAPDWLCAIIAKLHAKNPEDRFQSAKEVADLLARCQASLQQQGRVELPGELTPFLPKPPSAKKPQPAVTPPTTPAAVRKGPRRLAAVACVLLALFAGLGLSEATGVTKLRGTIIRLFSPDGTLVVEVDDPGVSVSIDGEEMVITGAGAKEIRLKPGQYKVLARKDGKVVRQELVTVTKNGRQVVKVSKEGVTAAAVSDASKTDTDGPSPPRFKNSAGMEFALVPEGKSWLGGGGGKPGDKEVEFKEDFYLGVYEVTQEEWEKVVGANPSHFSRSGNGKDAVKDIPDVDLKRFPVENVSWNDAQAFLEKLNQRENKDGWMYRLPTAAEWEYACRGGPSSDKFDSAFDYYFEKPSLELKPTQANVNESLKRTCKVGSYEPNRLGLHDLHGNVAEWCADLGPPPKFDKKNASWATFKSGRWNSKPEGCRAQSSGGNPPSSRGNGGGLRVARVRVGATSPNRFTNSLGMEFALVPKGKGWLGPAWLPLNEVEFKDDFYLGVHEVTQHEWQAVMGLNPSEFSLKNAKSKGVSDEDVKRFPVESVSWQDAQKFLEALNKRENEPGWVYRLPTRAEWEYACRGGPLPNKLDYKLSYYFEQPSNECLPEQANTNLRKSWHPCRVGSFKPNRLGLHDMHGNVWEWTDNENPPGPRDPKKETERNIVGGSFWEPPVGAWACKPYVANARSPYLGLRVARVRVVANPDRRAAEYVLSIGGTVRVNDQELDYRLATDLPREPFRLTTVTCSGYNPRISAEGLANFEGCKNLTHLTLCVTDKVTDATMAHFKDCKNLTRLHLDAAGVTSVGLANFGECKELRELHLVRVQVGDAGMAQFKNCTQLTHLTLSRDLKVGDAGLAFFKDCKNLIVLDLSWLPVRGPGLAHFKDCKDLRELYLPRTWIGDDGLAHFKDCKHLTDLRLNTTQVTDVGLESLAELKMLQMVNLRNTKVTAKGVKKLAAALPQCKIEWDDSVIEPKGAADPDRRAAEWVLSVGGTVVLDHPRVRTVSESSKLPVGLWTVTEINLHGKPVTDALLTELAGLKQLQTLGLWETQVTDAGLKELAGLKSLKTLALRDTQVIELKGLSALTNLESLDLGYTSVTDAGLKELAGMKSLQSVNLVGTKVTAAGMHELAGLDNLRSLILQGTRVSDEGVKELAGLKKLLWLSLYATPVTDEGVKHIAGLKDVQTLDLARTRVTDTGLKHLADLKNLRTLSLVGTQVTDPGLTDLGRMAGLTTIRVLATKATADGVKKLAASLPKCKIEWDGGVVDPKDAAPDDKGQPEKP